MNKNEVFAIGHEEALLSDDPIVRIVARGAVSGWVGQFQAWINDEYARAHDKPDLKADLMIAVTRLMVLTHSSFIANLTSEDGFPVAAETMKDFIDDEYVRHAIMCQAVIQGQRRSRP